MSLAQTEAQYTQLKSATDRLVGVVDAERGRVAALQAEVAALQAEIQLLTYTSATLESLLKAVSVESLDTVEQLVTYGLRTIFDDQQLSFKMVVSTKFKAQWMEPRLVDKGVEGPILDAFGGGPATVVAFLLRVLVCKRLGLAPVILLDEPFAMVSTEYVENVARLLQELAAKLGFTFIMVTQDRGFTEYADHAYEAQETAAGTVFKEESHGREKSR